MVDHPPLACVQGHHPQEVSSRASYTTASPSLPASPETWPHGEVCGQAIWPDVKAEGLVELSFMGRSIIFPLKGFVFKPKRKTLPLLPCYSRSKTAKKTRASMLAVSPNSPLPAQLLEIKRAEGLWALNTKGSAGTWTERVPSWMVYSFPTADVTNYHRKDGLNDGSSFSHSSGG